MERVNHVSALKQNNPSKHLKKKLLSIFYIKKIITEAADAADVAVRDKVARIEADAYAAARDKGMTVYEPTAEEIEAWRAGSQTVIDNYKTTAGELGATILEAAESLRN